MALPPTFVYDANKISPGVDLTLTGVGTPNLTATYGDYGADGTTKKASCVLSINYTNINYTINGDNSITVTGNVSGGVLVRTATGESAVTYQGITAWFNDVQTFYQEVYTASSGTYDLNLPSSFSVTIPPSYTPTTQWPASIHFKNDNLQSAAPPDEFNLGLGITNPNPPDYRPGTILDGSSVWQSHNRSGGTAHILTSGGTWSEMRTADAPTGKGNPPSIRKSDAWFNMAKLGKE